MVYQPLIRDMDNDTIFGLESAMISLLDNPDGTDERIYVSELTLEGLLNLGIASTGKYYYYYNDSNGLDTLLSFLQLLATI